MREFDFQAPVFPRPRGSAANSWSASDVRRLRELAQSGLGPNAIAQTLRRSESAVRNKAGLHGISFQRRRRDEQDMHVDRKQA